MKEQSEWIDFRELDFNDPENNRFNIDTRDFCAGYYFENEKHKDIKQLMKSPEFFFTEQELKDLLNRLYIESGGEGDWRFMDLKVDNQQVNNWNIKYIRIWRTNEGFLVCNSQNVAIRKSIWSNPVKTEHLNFCKE